jgi:peptide/nickel transport system substrate-binding protein
VRDRIGLAVLLLVALTTPAAAGPKALVYHLSAAPDLLDPAKCSNQRCYRVMWPIFEPLVNLSADLKTIVPGLAESWEQSADGLSYTFRLRKNVRFHDGTPLTADAVRLSVERNFRPGSRFYTSSPPNVREKALGSLIKEITVVDDHTVTIALRNRQVRLLFQAPVVSPAALARYGDKFGEHPVGTGPFMLAQAGSEEVRLSANPAYWGGRPKLDEIVFRVVPSSATATDEFLSGRLDFLPEVEPIYLERIIASPRAKLIRIPALSTYYLGLRVDRKPLDDARVRRAIASAIDVERGVLYTSRGTAVPAFTPIPPGGEAYEAALRKPRYNVEAARRALGEAGTSGLRLTLLYNSGWGFLSELAQAIKADLGKVGIAVELVAFPGWKELVAQIRQGQGDLFIYGWISLLPDPEIFLGSLFETKSVENLTGYSNPGVDALLHQARTPVDPAVRLDLYQRAQRMIVEDPPMVFLYHEVRVSAYGTRVSGLDLNAQSHPVDRFSRVDVREE